MKSSPGTVFSFKCERGMAVGLVTLVTPFIGPLVWIAEPLFDKTPSIDDLNGMGEWRWATFFEVGSAAHRGLIQILGSLDIPPNLREPVLFRFGNTSIGWREGYLDKDGRLRPHQLRSKPQTQVYKSVNFVALKELVDIDWRPRDAW